MSKVKGKISLGLVVLLVILSISTVFADDVKRIYNLTATYDGQTLVEGKTYTAVAGKTINVTVNPTYVDNTLQIAHVWGNEAMVLDATGKTTASFKVPNYPEGTEKVLQIESLIKDNAHNYVGNSNRLTVTFKYPSTTEVEANVYYGSQVLSEDKVVELKPGSKLKIVVTSNKDFKALRYKWEGADAVESTVNNLEITVPNGEAGKVITLKVKGAASDNITSPMKTYSIRLAGSPTPTPTPVTPVDDELIVEDWMKENKDLEGLAVSLRNDSDDYDKKNKNIYELGEKVVYYVDYKNGGKDIDQEVRLVLNLPLDFDVVDAFGGTVDKEKKTITWTFADGLEKGQAGTKVVVIKYTSLGKASKKSEVIYPSAEIFVGNSKSPKDVSSVINLIFKDEDTEINDEHYPYMIGDLEAPTFRPDDGIKRAEGALVLARIFGLNYSGTQVVGNEFSDLDETYLEAQKAIVASSKMGLISGFPDGSFRPNERMTKAQFMRIIASYVEVKAEEDNIKGLEIKEAENAIKLYKNTTNVYMTGATSTEAHWAVPYVTLLARINMTPVSSTHKNLGLDEEITRAEVAQLVNFYLLRAPAEEGKVQFTDVPRNHKLYADILEATMPAHTYTLTNEGTEVRVDD